MAARRLIAVMLVLLFLSSLAAALAPVEQQRDETSTTTTQPLPDLAATDARLIRRSIDAGAKRTTIEAVAGDQLQLRVTGRRSATIELVGIGATEDLDPEAPARFDVLLEAKGTFPVRELESGRRIGKIEVSRPALTGPAPDQARSRS